MVKIYRDFCVVCNGVVMTMGEKNPKHVGCYENEKEKCIGKSEEHSKKSRECSHAEDNNKKNEEKGETK